MRRRSRRRRRGGGVFAPLLVLVICFVGVFLFTHPDLIAIPESGVLLLPDQQPQATPSPTLYEEIHARYGNKYDGYENLIRRTSSGGFDTREADAAMAGQPLTVPVRTTPTVEIPPRSNPASSATPGDEIEAYIYQYTNDKRRANGISSLITNSCLTEIARAHSRDMAANNYFSHDNLQGQDPSARAAAHGCPTRKSAGGGMTLTGIAENIGKMPTGNVIGHGYVQDTPQSVARAQVDSWMSSPGHRANILNPTYSSIGVGTAKDTYGYYISTQDFW